MTQFFINWKTQIRKGYLELCVLLFIEKNKKLYGFDLIEKLKNIELEVKEGTLYPLLSRMTEEKLLQAVWETENIKGHPRKFYSLTSLGRDELEKMKSEFYRMIEILESIQKLEIINKEKKNVHPSKT